MTTMIQELFIKKAHKVHKNKYDYSKVIYINSKTKVEIICPIHGAFLQRPAGHLSGRGCPQCGKEATFLTTEKFIRKAKKKHGDKYDYSRVAYQHSHIKVNINCPVHGNFYQRPGDHLAGQGCPQCGSTSSKNKQRSTTEEFTKKANIVHNNKYDYSKTNYKHSRTPVEIICSIHGSFMQTPHEHLQGCGCQKCGFVNSTKKFFEDVPTLLYVVQFTPDIIKVGITTRTTKERFRSGKKKPTIIYERQFERGLDAFFHEQMLLLQTLTHRPTYKQAMGILPRDKGITELRLIAALPYIQKYLKLI